MGTVLIAGAGIGGLAAAVALRRAGWRVTVFERAAEARELGFALVMAPNAMTALRQLGLADAVLAAGAVARVGEVRRADGSVMKRIHTAAVAQALGEETVCILRPALHSILMQAAGSDCLRLHSAVAAFRQESGKVVVTLEGGATESGDVLIGADGRGSLVRKFLHPHEPAAEPSGLFALRGVAQHAAHLFHGLSGVQYYGRGVEIGMARASETAVYWYMSIPSAMAAPLRNDPAALARRVAESFDQTVQQLVAATQPQDLRVDELRVRKPLPFWGKGAVTLLGDAAHPMLPHAGQGAAQAIEDAAALGRLLPADAVIDRTLREYEALRIPRTAAVVEIAARNARIASVENPAACWIRDWTMRLIPERVLLRSFIDLGRPPVS